MGKGFLYASSHRQDSTYHSLSYTSRGALAGTMLETKRKQFYHHVVFRRRKKQSLEVIDRNGQECSLMVQWVIGSILHGGPIELLFIPASALCSGSSRFPLLLSKWSFTICPMPNNYKNVSSVSLNKTPFIKT